MPRRPRRFPRLSGDAEDVLVLKPDIVVAGRFTKRATRELLKEKGLRVVEFDAARSLDDVKNKSAGWAISCSIRIAPLPKSARLDAAIAARARGRVAQALPCAGAVAARLGFRRRQPDNLAARRPPASANAAAELGFKLGGFASLEAIVSLRPDFLLVSDGSDFAEDEGSAFLLHPALERFYPRRQAPRHPGKAHRVRRPDAQRRRSSA